MASVTNINEVLEGHIGLDLSCVDRIYLNAYVSKLQVAGQLVTFLTDHLGFPIPSPALLEKIGNRFRQAVKAFAREKQIPILQLKKPDRTRWDDRKLDHVRPFLDNAEAEGRHGVVAIVQAQEFQWVFSSKKRASRNGAVSFDFYKEERRVGIYYLYLNDAEFGPGFVKNGSRDNYADTRCSGAVSGLRGPPCAARRRLPPVWPHRSSLALRSSATTVPLFRYNRRRSRSRGLLFWRLICALTEVRPPVREHQHRNRLAR